MSRKLDFKFREGFWKYTLQRFFAIGAFHKECPNRSVTHIESDVLLMPNFPWQKFADLKKLAWLKVNSAIDVAAIVHFPTLYKTQKLLEEISRLSRLNPGTNDMRVLHEAAITLEQFHEYLPSLTSSNYQKHENFSATQERSLNHFGGIFDPLNLGLWYFGQDPKNSFGMRKRYVGDLSHDVNPIDSGLSLKTGKLSDKNGTSIFSLHIHSKYLPLFGPNWERALELGLNQALTKKRRCSFNLIALLQALRGRKLRQNVWILILLFPALVDSEELEVLKHLKTD
jgi:hypothetical protein